MKQATRQRLAEIARKNAEKPFHGDIAGRASNLAPMIRYFPRWSVGAADRLWCAAFVYYCCVQAGFLIPYSPRECVTCSLAGCGGWEEYAMGDRRIGYHRPEEDFSPGPGDIVLFDRVFNGQEHDHIGILLEARSGEMITAEGNTFHDNISRVLHRPIDGHIRAYIRIPDGYRY